MRIAALLLGAIVSLPVAGQVVPRSEDIVPSANGRIDTDCPAGDCDVGGAPLTWSGASTGLNNAGIGSQSTGTAFSHNVCQYLEGDESTTATISIVSVSGDDPATEGWALSASTCASGTSNLTHPGSQTGSGRMKLRADGTGTNDDDSGEFNWAYSAPVGSSGFDFPCAPSCNASNSAFSLTATPRYHTASLYWDESNGGSSNEAVVRFKDNSTGVWKQGLSLYWDDRVDGTGLGQVAAPYGKQYRGMIFGLTPGTSYTVEVMTQNTTRRIATATFTTLAESWPCGTTITPDATSNSTLTISTAGSPGAYTCVTRAGGFVIDGNNAIDNGIVISAPYVRVYGQFEIKETRQTGIFLDSDAANFVIDGSGGASFASIHHFGREDPVNDGLPDNDNDGNADDHYGCNDTAGIRTDSGDNFGVANGLIQNVVIHTPNYDANTWEEVARPKSTGCYSPGTSHPGGSNVIFLKNTGGGMVIRYIQAYSDDEHLFDDGIGGGQNMSINGPFPKDSDIYGNILSHIADDSLEFDGGLANVAAFENYVSLSLRFGSTACNCIGPFYFMRNVQTGGRDGHDQDENWIPSATGGGGSSWKPYTNNDASTPAGTDLGLGRTFWFHNTVYKTSASNSVQAPFNSRPGSAAVGNMYGRNNIIHTDADLSSGYRDLFFLYSDYKYNVVGAGHSQWTTESATNIISDPVYDTTSPPSGTQTLETTSPGLDAGEVIPNINDSGSRWPYRNSAGTLGAGAPDIGAVERGQTAPVYGPR